MNRSPSPAQAGFLAGLASLAVGLAVVLAGCAGPPAPTPTTSELPFEEAVAQATDSLVTQTQQLPTFLAKVESRLNKRGVVLDPMLDSTTGQQTAATQLLETRVSERMTTKYEQFEILPFRAENLGRAQYLLTGTMTRAPGAKALQINLALTDLKSGNVVAQASALSSERGLDSTPLPYYRDSPVLVKDQVIEGYVITSTTPPGRRADTYYLERIAAATLIQEATVLYNEERYPEALGQYRSALATPQGEQMRVLNGLYLTNAKLGRTVEAEQAFGRVVAFGIAYQQLGVKFLFNPGSTEFWSDPKVSGAYPMWLRQIARESTGTRVCMIIVGHTSRTGSEQTNDALSLQRANFIRQKLATESAALGSRTKTAGMGFRQNIVGSGTDNAVDALDRRVEFRIIPCT